MAVLVHPGSGATSLASKRRRSGYIQTLLLVWQTAGCARATAPAGRAVSMPSCVGCCQPTTVRPSTGSASHGRAGVRADHQRIDRFQRRGRSATQSEWRLVAATHNLRVTIVEPGRVRTDFGGRSLQWGSPIEDYAELIAPARLAFETGRGKQHGDPRRAAQAIVAAVELPQPPLCLPLGPDAFGGFGLTSTHE
jgi:hypothetical protein